MDYSKLNDIIKSSKNILIISHVNPDGDTLGSMCGLYSAILENYKKKCDMMAISKVPDVYSYIPHLNEVKNIDYYDKSREYDLIINVDVAAIDRICDAKILFDKEDRFTFLFLIPYRSKPTSVYKSVLLLKIIPQIG